MFKWQRQAFEHARACCELSFAYICTFLRMLDDLIGYDAQLQEDGLLTSVVTSNEGDVFLKVRWYAKNGVVIACMNFFLGVPSFSIVKKRSHVD